MGIQSVNNVSKNLLFYIDSFYVNFMSEHKFKTIILPYLNSILKKDKVYFLKTGYDINLKEDVFEEVTYQKYIID
ncbi:hypothetical protein [Frigoriflavimonas asaccharolytica]|uniref:Uncharacterized protein n=1 Tax=Frigoriflavimonas asaccharolytica TaxID=2735899 RepID=A0A8J8GDM5_9FLAO|nr:hypothetical protein [Frigoriflavimonas asaccharolytica]NRS93877.1 hypothetical protein [Frigoriflavimonas asaccharolytica]